MSEPVMDFPEAFAFVKEHAPNKDEHHPKCSYRQAGMLCDCSIIWAEYYKRRYARLEQERDAMRAALGKIADISNWPDLDATNMARAALAPAQEPES